MVPSDSVFCISDIVQLLFMKSTFRHLFNCLFLFNLTFAVSCPLSSLRHMSQTPPRASRRTLAWMRPSSSPALTTYSHPGRHPLTSGSTRETWVSTLAWRPTRQCSHGWPTLLCTLRLVSGSPYSSHWLMCSSMWCQPRPQSRYAIALQFVRQRTAHNMLVRK